MYLKFESNKEYNIRGFLPYKKGKHIKRMHISWRFFLSEDKEKRIIELAYDNPLNKREEKCINKILKDLNKYATVIEYYEDINVLTIS